MFRLDWSWYYFGSSQVTGDKAGWLWNFPVTYLGFSTWGHPSWWTWINLHLQSTRRFGTEPQEFVHHPMLDTWVATRSILFSRFLLKTLWNFSAFQLNKKNSNRVNSSRFWVVYLLVACCNQPSSEGWLVGWSGWGNPKQPLPPTNLGTRGSRRPAAASAQCLWEAGDTRRPGGLCRAAGAQGWGVESQKPKPVWQLLQLSGVLKVGLRDGKWWNLKFIYALYWYDVCILYLINILEMYGLFTVNRLYENRTKLMK